MYQNLSTNEAIKLLKEDDNTHWSWAGAQALIEYLEELEEQTNKKIEFDRVAIRCEYSEYETALDAAKDYDFIPSDEDDEDEIEAAALEYLQDQTTVIEFEGGVIIRLF